MPRITLTIEDNSPVLQYSTQWEAGNSQDNAADRYSLSSFTLSNTNGSWMSFVYSGYDVHVYGAKRANHGNYRVDIDNGTTSFEGNGSIPGDGSFQVSLFSPSTPMANGLHNLTLTNQENKFLDVDFLTWQSAVGEDNEQLLMNTFDDMHSAFSYFPSSSWTTNPPNQSRYFGTTGHMTSDPNAYMEFAFQGDAITLYGPVDPSGSAYTVELDGGPAQRFTTNKASPQAQMLMYQAFNLGPGAHKLTMRYASSVVSATQGQQFLAVDYATVYTTPSIQKAADAATKVSGGAIAGLVVGNLILLLIIILGMICLYRYKKYGYVDWRSFLRPFKHKRMSEDFKQELQLPRPFNISVPPTTNVLVDNRWTSGKRRLLRMSSWRWPTSTPQQSSSWRSSRYQGSYDMPASSIPVRFAIRAPEVKYRGHIKYRIGLPRYHRYKKYPTWQS
ncbi:hypothetical protein BDQ17DRAFT_1346717 [Cyathus striatus]|nr:hypothetical protein BDQ17DRAFT_1346717 [Cyathus striatus]